jgi:hypothetical protein
MYIVEVNGKEVYRTSYGIERAATEFDIAVRKTDSDKVELIEKQIGLGRKTAWSPGYTSRKVIYSYTKEPDSGLD